MERTQLRTLIDVAALNSRVVMEMKPVPLTAAEKSAPKAGPPEEMLTPNGDATELGLYRYFGSCVSAATGLNIEEYRAQNPKIHEVPFNSSNKWQMSVHAMHYMGGKQLLLLKVSGDFAFMRLFHLLILSYSS